MSDTDGHSEETASASTTEPLGTVLRATLGPFGAAIGGVVGANRIALTAGVKTARPTASDDGMSEATTIEIEDGTGDSDDGPASGPDRSSDAGPE